MRFGPFPKLLALIVATTLLSGKGWEQRTVLRAEYFEGRTIRVILILVFHLRMRYYCYHTYESHDPRKAVTNYPLPGGEALLHIHVRTR